jgi:hypothetical protein
MLQCGRKGKSQCHHHQTPGHTPEEGGVVACKGSDARLLCRSQKKTTHAFSQCCNAC